ncbi:aspartyl/asparaginyl beta-hydroxylase domain-containing protein [Ekhidna sp.]|uniref:aspartyl/asparaginyl beta-hydroxylase domain-containing protein n=1 Tax=Ekhidna sp. TaxID=2608089 RepID=UPI003BA8B770
MNILERINDIFRFSEGKGWIERTPSFIHDYKKSYPKLSILEDNHSDIREECEKLLAYKEKITNMEGLYGEMTVGGIHDIKWKSFVFKSGRYVEKNCEMCPKTAALLKQIPRVKQAFFSILDPNQYIRPHQGYYYGFLRYHLGVIIPNNNENNKCWIRINDDPIDNKNNDDDSIIKGEKYHWRNGEGIMFNDNYIHDAENGSDEVRVILWIDIARKFPWPLEILNRLILKLAYFIPDVKKASKRAEVDFDFKPKYT